MIEDIEDYEQAWMVQYCCSATLNSSDSRNFTWNPKWQPNNGNPDLGTPLPQSITKTMLTFLADHRRIFKRSVSFGPQSDIFWHQIHRRPHGDMARSRDKAQNVSVNAHEAAVIASASSRAFFRFISLCSSLGLESRTRISTQDRPLDLLHSN